uniref:Uncharacterized protein n=1 Tax=Pyricularia oryzae (strain P131) TaxID=1143193 RepID=L7IY64_PYRO1
MLVRVSHRNADFASDDRAFIVDHAETGYLLHVVHQSSAGEGRYGGRQRGSESRASKHFWEDLAWLHPTADNVACLLRV